MYNDYLAHHGIKGMRWGVRHDPERSGRKATRRSVTDKKELRRRRLRRVAIGAALLGGGLIAGHAVRRSMEKSANRKSIERLKNYADGPVIVKRQPAAHNVKPKGSISNLRSNVSSVNKELNNTLNELKRRAAATKASTMNDRNWGSSADYTQELLRKNGAKLSGYTMRDLRDLDLY